MTDGFFNRTTELFDLESLEYREDGTTIIERPENALVRIRGYAHPVDFGAWCYTKRHRSDCGSRSNLSSIQIVDTSSFRKERRFLVGEYIGHIATMNRQSVAIPTLKTSIANFRHFLNWCDLNSPSGLDHQNNINGTFKLYSRHLHIQIQLNKLSRNTAAQYQKDVLRALVAIFDDDTGAFTQGVKSLSASRFATNVTECPSESEATIAIKTSLCLFLQLSDFTLSWKKFPYEIDLPNSSYWFFPCQQPFLSNELKEEDQVKKCYVAYDYSTGNIRSSGEIAQRISLKGQGGRRYASQSRHTALGRIEAANTDFHHERRIFAAVLAAESFINLFAANTGMNASNIGRIPWDEDYSVTQKTVGFKTLKPRAKNRATEFIISSGFLKHLKTFIKTREYILTAIGESDFPFLFFHYARGNLRPLNDDISYPYNSRVRENFGIQLNITTRRWRALKSDWLIRNTDIATTAMVLQNSPETVMKHYAEGSLSAAKEEITRHLSQYKDQLVATSKEATTEIPIGSCASYQNPAPFANSAPSLTDCVTAEGCIGCQHYRVQPDLTDLTKLFSFRYLLEFSITLVRDDSHFESLQQPVIRRIKAIEELLISSDLISNEEVAQAREAVFQHEELHPYWSNKLDLLTKLEIL